MTVVHFHSIDDAELFASSTTDGHCSWEQQGLATAPTINYWLTSANEVTQHPLVALASQRIQLGMLTILWLYRSELRGYEYPHSLLNCRPRNYQEFPNHLNLKIWNIENDRSHELPQCGSQPRNGPGWFRLVLFLILIVEVRWLELGTWRSYLDIWPSDTIWESTIIWASWQAGELTMDSAFPKISSLKTCAFHFQVGVLEVSLQDS